MNPRPGGGLINAPAITAIGVMAINDHWAKHTFGNWWTGKLSDFAVMLFFPFMLQAFVEFAQQAASRYRGPSLTVLRVCILTTAIGFAAINTLEPAAQLYRCIWGGFHWVMDLVLTGSTPRYALAHFTLDPTDVITEISLLWAYLLGKKRST